jgi:hypothetical protein
LLGKHGLRDHKFADHVYKPVDARQIDPDGCRPLRGARCGDGLGTPRLRICAPLLHLAGCRWRRRLNGLALDLERAILIDKFEDLRDRRIRRSRA